MAKTKQEIHEEEFRTMLEEKTWSGHMVVPHHIVEREEAHEYIALHDLKVLYQAELNDGTPRRFWSLIDSNGQTCGKLFTARGTGGYRNKDKFQQDIFDFMEINVSRGKYKKGEKNIAG
tara:strand:- start:69 stop:425 length:357 start_codon:yes stop_codon:yes gene_type:complete